MDNAPITIRPYREGDLPEMRRITVESFGSVALEQMLEHKFGIWNGRNWQTRKADHIDDDVAVCGEGCFVAERGGEILGYITVRLDRLNAKGRIPNLAVLETARGLGLGRRLIQHAVDYMRREGMKLAQIETMASNAIGQHLYPSCGFEEVGRQVHYAMTL
ncbi:MAG: GNAT family N-acetyltransferase [Verrucomicrobiaceae bacterium]